MKMTISLLQAFDWYKECPPDWKAKAKQQIIGQLNKEPFTNVAVDRGQRYEDQVCQALMTGQPVHPELECLRNMRQQAWLQPVTIKGYTFRGKMDFDDESSITDLKSTKKYSMRSYCEKKQHLVYCLAEKKTVFNYKVAVFPNEDGLEPTTIHTISLIVDLAKAEETVGTALTQFENWLKEENLWDLYYDVYNGGQA